MSKRTVKVIVVVLLSILQMNMFSSYGVEATESWQNAIVLSSYNFSNGDLKLEGSSSVDTIKIKIVNQGRESWYDVDLVGGRFAKNIFLCDSKTALEVYIMVDKGNYDFEEGLHFTVNAVNQGISVLGASKDTYSSENSSGFEALGKFSDDSIESIVMSITADCDNDYEKAKKIYDWVSNNITYDRKKYRRLLNNDFSDEYGAMYAFENRKGICYDFASLVSELAREAGLRAKLVKGDYILSDGRREYHAWNEIFIRDSWEWIPMDTTFASVYRKNYFNTGEFYFRYDKQEVENN